MSQFGLSLAAAGINPRELARHELGDAIFAKLKEQYEQKEHILGAPQMPAIARAWSCSTSSMVSGKTTCSPWII